MYNIKDFTNPCMELTRYPKDIIDNILYFFLEKSTFLLYKDNYILLKDFEDEELDEYNYGKYVIGIIGYSDINGKTFINFLNKFCSSSFQGRRYLKKYFNSGNPKLYLKAKDKITNKFKSEYLKYCNDNNIILDILED